MDMDNINESFSKQYALANEASQIFSQYLWKNPQKALDALFDWYNTSLDKAYTDENGQNVRGFIETIAGGPFEAIPTALYNNVGAIYPILDRETKNLALGKILNILDDINCKYVQLSHTPYIKEPLLLADIVTVRRLYWPGLEEGQRRINDCDVFPDFHAQYMYDGYFKKGAVDSDFVVAYALLRNDISRWGDAFAEAANPSFLERVLQGVLTMRLTLDHNVLQLADEDVIGVDQEQLNKKVQNRIARRKDRVKTLFPEKVHPKLDYLAEKNDWLNIFDFTNHRDHHIEKVIKHVLDE